MQISRTYQFDFNHTVDKLWAIVSDTPRWGEASGFPKYQVREQLQPDGTVKVFGQVEIAGFKISWEEPPVNWIAERWFEQRRVFSSGPMRSMTTDTTLTALGEKSRLEMKLVFETRNLVGSLLAKRLAAAFEPKIRQLLDNADQLIKAEEPDLFVSSYQPSQSALDRAAKMLDAITDSPYEHGLSRRLLDYINDSQEVDLWTMRPIAIARRWKSSTQNVVELFLQAVRAGLLESRWDILCPRCRVSKAQTSNMGELPDGVHCDACNIDFDSDFARNVELCFSPSQSIRPVEYGYFCRSGPGVTPHVKSQCSLAPGESRSLPLVLEKGDYRLRTLEAGDEIDLSWKQGPFPEIQVDQDRIEISGESPRGEIQMHNPGSLQRTVVIEQQSWLRDVLTAEQVTTMQAFRDLFSDQLLRPGDDVSIRNISFMFTDLVGSAGLFQKLGDAAAYQLVREHFAELAGIVRHYRGSIVKTVGDGIHAAFAAPEDALAAAIRIQQITPELNRRLNIEGVSIRIGLHSGSSIAVTLNQRLDYYGEAVNLAARLEGQGDAGEITMSTKFADDPAVQRMLQSHPVRRREVPLKGYDEPVSIAHVKPPLDQETGQAEA